MTSTATTIPADAGNGKRDLTPTWAGVVSFYTRLAADGERKACAVGAPEVMRAAHMADALNALLKSGDLTEEQQALICPFLLKAA